MNTAGKINFLSNEDTPLLAAGFFIKLDLNHTTRKQGAACGREQEHGSQVFASFSVRFPCFSAVLS
jgi:hypothetical protein